MVPTIAPLQPFFNNQPECPSSRPRPSKLRFLTEVRDRASVLVSTFAGAPRAVQAGNGRDSMSKPSNDTAKIQEPDGPRIVRVRAVNGSKIKKPAGEPGRPGRGGYTLKQKLMQYEQLNWGDEEYKNFAVRYLGSGGKSSDCHLRM